MQLSFLTNRKGFRPPSRNELTSRERAEKLNTSQPFLILNNCSRYFFLSDYVMRKFRFNYQLLQIIRLTTSWSCNKYFHELYDFSNLIQTKFTWRRFVWHVHFDIVRIMTQLNIKKKERENTPSKYEMDESLLHLAKILSFSYELKFHIFCIFTKEFLYVSIPS